MGCVIGGFQGGFLLSVKAFNQTIGDRMVGRCSDTGGSKEVSEQSEEGTFKLSNAIGGNEIGNAESGNPVYKD